MIGEKGEPEYPPAPWRLGGQQWGAMFRTDRAVVAGEAESLGARKLFSNRLGIAVMRYTSGTLSYDEFIVAVPIRHRWKPSLWIRNIWVSDVQSQAGGVDLWNLPKQLATFTWDDDRVTIADKTGMVATVGMLPTKTHWPWAVCPVRFSGANDGQLSSATSTWCGRVSFSRPTIIDWSGRFDERPLAEKALGFSSPKFRMLVRAS